MKIMSRSISICKLLAMILLAPYLSINIMAAPAHSDSTPYIYYHNVIDGVAYIGRANLDGTNAQNNFIRGLNDDYESGQVWIQGSFVYWSSRNSVLRANLDGTGSYTTLITSGGRLGGVATDGQYLYWTDRTNGYIGRANLDGSSPNNTFINTSIGGPSNAYALFISSSFIYWADYGYGKIGRANIDGTNPNNSFIITPSSSPTGIWVANDKIYWADWRTCRIGRSEIDSSGVNENFIQDSNCRHPFHIVLDSNYIYWTDQTSNGSIFRANIDGSSVVMLFTQGAIYQPIGLAIYPSGINTSNQSNAAVAHDLLVRKSIDEIIFSLRLNKPITVQQFTNADITGATEANIALINNEISNLLPASRTNIKAALKVVRKYEVLGIIGSDRISTITTRMLIEVGLLQADNKYRFSLTMAVKGLPLSNRSTYAAIQSAIKAEMDRIQAKKDKQSELIARIRARAAR